MTATHPHVIIVGAGIIGASLTYHLVCQNARVTLIDKATKPAKEATEKSFAWISAGHEGPETYLNLRQQAIAEWHKVEDEFKGQLRVDWSGALSWRSNMIETERIASHLLNLGFPVHLADRKEIHLLEPNLKHVPAQAMFARDEGAIDPTRTTNLFIKAARERGANIQTGNEILSFMTNGSRIEGVVTANGKVTADIVVLAAGINSAILCQPLGLTLPVTVSPAILMIFHTTHRFVNRIVSNPLMEVRAASNTLTLAAEEYIDESPENCPQAIAQRLLNKIKKHWQGAEQLSLANIVVGRRAIPIDGLPVIGRTTAVDGLYLSVMHAGVTLAAIAGRLAAAEILNDQEDRLLSSYRLKRCS